MSIKGIVKNKFVDLFLARLHKHRCQTLDAILVKQQTLLGKWKKTTMSKYGVRFSAIKNKMEASAIRVILEMYATIDLPVKIIWE